ncbi:MAG TPA: ABC transporter substrate-binding protein [Acetobacteraceae bacterium]|nr:ABC transporter substrate-binding protein [Acetobacteraceae bacterium]
MSGTTTIGRRAALGLGLASGAAALARPAQAAGKEVKIGMLMPFTGPWAREGILERLGAEMAIDDVNAAGGIKALGGAKLALVPYDTQDTAERAKDGATRMIADHPELMAALGCWLSTFTLAATEVSERARLPWLTHGYSDAITARGFHYVFDTSAPASYQAAHTVPALLAMARAAGKHPARVAIIGDNTAASVSFTKPLRAHVLKDLGLKLVLDETYTPPLADASGLVQPLRSAHADFLLLASSNVPDDKLMLDALHEFGLSSRLPALTEGGHMVAPEVVQTTGADIVQGMMAVVTNWPGPGTGPLVERFIRRTKEAWMGQESIFAYGHIMLLRYLLEHGAAATREGIAQGLRTIDITDGPALYFPGHRLQFDAKGQRVGATLVIVQWQDGKPVAVYPPDTATSRALWA